MAQRDKRHGMAYGGQAKKAFRLSLELWSSGGMPLTACSMFTRSFVLQTGIWLISELVVHARIPVTIPFRLPLYLPLFLPSFPSHSLVLSLSLSFSLYIYPSLFSATCFSIRTFIGPLSRQNAICRTEFIERVRAFTHANAFYVRPDNIAACLESFSAPYAAVWFQIAEQCGPDDAFVSANLRNRMLRLLID